MKHNFFGSSDFFRLKITLAHLKADFSNKQTLNFTHSYLIRFKNISYIGSKKNEIFCPDFNTFIFCDL
jgi:hypothetical protein